MVSVSQFQNLDEMKFLFLRALQLVNGVLDSTLINVVFEFATLVAFSFFSIVFGVEFSRGFPFPLFSIWILVFRKTNWVGTEVSYGCGVSYWGIWLDTY